MPAHSLKFYFDYNSPYAYMASTQIEAVCARQDTELQWLPVVLGGIFKAKDIVPPHMHPHRRAYMLQDLQDLAEYYDVPYQPRSEFLFNPILSQRATLCVGQGPQRGKAVHALYRGAFVENLNLGDRDVVVKLLDKAGFDGKDLVEKTQQQAIKDELRAITDQAIEEGMFGAPTFMVDNKKLFWGQDRMPLLENYLSKA